MNPGLGLSILSGMLLGVGLWITFLRVPAMRRPTFAERVAPQLRSLDASSRLLRSDLAAPTLERILGPILREALTSISGLGVARSGLDRRLAQAGSSRSAIEFRSEQVLCAGLAFALGSALAIGGASAGRISAFLAVLLSLSAGAAGFLGREFVLKAAVRRRRRRILAEFPSMADMLALAVGAGETAGALVDAASSGARYGALADRGPMDGSGRAAELAATALGPSFASDVTAARIMSPEGAPLLEVRVRAPLPLVGFAGPPRVLEVAGHAPLS